MVRLRTVTQVLSIVILFVPILALAQDLCPPPKPLLEGADDLAMEEQDFAFSKALKSIPWLEEDVWNVIREHKTTEELLRSTERFGIPFPNSVSTVKGVILRQQALLESERLEVARLRLKAGLGNEADVEAAQKRYDAARSEFCWFLDKVEWVD